MLIWRDFRRTVLKVNMGIRLLRALDTNYRQIKVQRQVICEIHTAEQCLRVAVIFLWGGVLIGEIEKLFH